MKTALVVDDEPLLRRQVAEALARFGFDEIIEGQNGQEALLLALTHKPILVIMDVSMPVMNGVQAAESIIEQAPAPIVLLTGSTDPVTIEKAREAGVMNYLVKPFRDEQLLPAIDLAIHQFIQVSNLKDKVSKLKQSLETRKVVDRAKGVLMSGGMSEQEAYRKLQKLSMDKRKTLQEVAEAVLLTA
ncbi:MAG: response regulator [Desulfuromonadaceae bacterium]